MDVRRVLPISFSGPFEGRDVIPLHQLGNTDIARVISTLNHKS